MKKAIVAFAFAALLAANAPAADNVPAEKETVSKDSLDRKPTFRGKGAREFSKWVSTHLRYPDEARGSYADGTVVVGFTIGLDGSVQNPEILVKGMHPALDAEVIRVLGKAPRWKPGMVDNHPVKVRMTLPVIFIADN